MRRGESLALTVFISLVLRAHMGIQMTYSWFSLNQIKKSFYTFFFKKNRELKILNACRNVYFPCIVQRANMKWRKRRRWCWWRREKKTTDNWNRVEKQQQQPKMWIRVNKFPYAPKMYLSWSHTYHNNFFSSHPFSVHISNNKKNARKKKTKKYSVSQKKSHCTVYSNFTFSLSI